jgi:hypothetical protein
MGLGAYSVKSNSLFSDSSQVPVMHSANETIRVTHREYIGDVFSSGAAGAFQVVTYPLQPGVRTVFPWLSRLAASFQEYSVLGFVAMFKSNSGEALNSTNTALGSVVMTASYNPAQPPFNSKTDMLNSMWAVEGKPSSNLMLPIECDPSQNPRGIHFIRTGAVTAERDSYDLCDIHVATVGCQGTNVNLGQLWFSYDIELRKPSAFVGNEGLDQPNLKARFDFTGGATITTWGSKLTRYDNSLGVTITDSSPTAARFTVPPGTEGTYRLIVSTNNVTPVGRTTPGITLVGCTAQTTSPTIFGSFSATIASTMSQAYDIVFDPQARESYIQLDNATPFFTSATQGHLSISLLRVNPTGTFA